MADFTTIYDVAQSESTPLDQRADIDIVDGPARFLDLAVMLGVPVISRKQYAGSGTWSAGGGLSFAVTRTNAQFKLWNGTGWANEVPRDWFASAKSQSSDPKAIVVKNYVNKRIVLTGDLRKRDGCELDERVLAAVSTEVKILAHEAVRRSSNIIALLGISWNTRETAGHFLPEINLEGAQHGNVDQYLRTNPDMDASCKALMLADIASGLAVLHANGIVHNDVKSGNMLVCDSPERQILEPIGLKPVIVKICDFGCSVILSDYPAYHRFSIKVGTPGWMSPEMEQGKPIELAMLSKTDIFSLGLVASTILTGANLGPHVLLNLATNQDLTESQQDSEGPCSLSDSRKEIATRPAKRKACSANERDELSVSWKAGIKASEYGAKCPSWESKTPQNDGNVNKTDFGLPSTATTSSPECLQGRQFILLGKILPRTLQTAPSDRGEAKEIYGLCRAHLLSNECSDHVELLRYVGCRLQIPC